MGSISPEIMSQLSQYGQGSGSGNVPGMNPSGSQPGGPISGPSWMVPPGQSGQGSQNQTANNIMVPGNYPAQGPSGGSTTGPSSSMGNSFGAPMGAK